MIGRVLIGRPQPGADRTAQRARAMGMEATVAPLFTIAPVAWQPVDAERFDCVLLTSANAARHGGAGLGPLLGLPCYAVGAVTAKAARQAGFKEIRSGPSTATALRDIVLGDGRRRPIHFAGRENKPIAIPDIEQRVVYAAEPVAALPDHAVAALGQGALALIHSPAAGALFSRLIDAAGMPRPNIRIAAISAAAAAAAGRGWAERRHAAEPRDAALLELAAFMCKEASVDGNGSHA